ncbi:MAG: T9SS C-terminal target domain-containing protein [Ignavibacteriae bacterium]|nr:MAG: T9SS C-terminal target domain-containing protein [Ignavibacteriota bacterium]
MKYSIIKIYLFLLFINIFTLNLYSQWINQPSGITAKLNSVSAVDNQIVWACGDSSKVVKSTNGGTSWINVSNNGINGNKPLITIFAVNQNLAFVEALYTGIFRTINGGNNWTLVHATSKFIDGISFNNENEGIIIGDPDGIQEPFYIRFTSNGGSNWYQGNWLYSLWGGSYINAIYRINNRLWFGFDGYIYFSNNQGWSWNTQQTTSLEVYSIYFKDSVNGVAGGLSGSGQQLKMTTTGGTSWFQIPAPGTSYTIGLAWKNNAIWCAKHTSYIYRTINNGNNWTEDLYYSATTFNHLSKARNGTRLWAVGTNGKIFLSEALIGINKISSTIPEKYILFQNYPNPFNPTTKIRFSLPLHSDKGMMDTKLIIYDVMGRVVADLTPALGIGKEGLAPGTYEVEWDASDNPSGIYFYRLITDGFEFTKKMLFLK